MALKLQFLNVGHGDCTIVEFPSGNLTVVDINVSPELLTNELVDMALSLEGFDHSSLYQQPTWSLQQLTKAFKEAAGLYPLSNPVDYLLANFPGQPLFRFVATHPHMDHLSGFADLLQIKRVWNI